MQTDRNVNSISREREPITVRVYPYPPDEGKVKWVSTDWLNEHLEDQELMIVDAQPDTYDYVQQHIPGAVYLSERVLRASLNGLPAHYVSPENIQSIFRNIGVKADLLVVVYTGTGAFRVQGDGAEQSMIAYTLVRFGHNKVYILDGGLDKWKEEGRILTKVFPKVRESKFRVWINYDYFVDYEEFMRIKDREDIVHLDTRPSKYYEGEGPWIKLGHIPGALSLPWTDLVDDRNPRLLKPEAEIKSILEKLGVTPDKTIILSCGTGRHATSTFTILKWYLGYPRVRIYEGSFTEWTAYPENPTVKAKNPK
nr:sulfurtransferase [Candidatus Njordarchaeum guaymaensis]